MPAMSFGFGPFQVVARLGVGPLAQTFLALEDAGERLRPVVLKTLLPQYSVDPKARRTFSDEAQIAARLDHASCVGVKEWGVHEGICWISTEYVAGEPWMYALKIAKRKLPENEVLFVIADVLAGLQYAHELRSANGPYNIVHRGISSKNVFIGDDGRARIIDFGTGKSRIVKDATETGVIKGSFRYMSPEQILGKTLDRRSDIYSAGEVLFESLVGPDSTGGGIEELAIAKLDGHPRISDAAPGVHPELDEICARALAVEPEDRYQTAAKMRRALLEYVDKLRRKPTHESVRQMLDGMYGNRIVRRAEVLEALGSGQVDDSDVMHALGATPADDKDVFKGPEGGYDEASFLAQIRPGQMDAVAPIKRQRAKPAKARLELRAPDREASKVPEPSPPTEMHPADSLAEAIIEASTEAVVEPSTEAIADEELELALLLAEVALPEDEDETGLVDPEPTSIVQLRKPSQKPKKS